MVFRPENNPYRHPMSFILKDIPPNMPTKVIVGEFNNYATIKSISRLHHKSIASILLTDSKSEENLQIIVSAKGGITINKYFIKVSQCNPKAAVLKETVLEIYNDFFVSGFPKTYSNEKKEKTLREFGIKDYYHSKLDKEKFFLKFSSQDEAIKAFCKMTGLTAPGVTEKLNGKESFHCDKLPELYIYKTPLKMRTLYIKKIPLEWDEIKIKQIFSLVINLLVL